MLLFRASLVVVAAVALLLAAASTALACADFTAAVNSCYHLVSEKTDPSSVCAHFRCIRDGCKAAGSITPRHLKLLDGVVGDFCNKKKNKVNAASSSSGSVVRAINVLPPEASPCHRQYSNWSSEEARTLLYQAGWAGYVHRMAEHYSEDAVLRWSGIHGKVCPPAAPQYSDCSSFVTWIYWTVFGKGRDFINNEAWTAGYTGTMVKMGREAPCDPASMQVGDAIFYYHPMHHVAFYAGNGTVFSHGFDPLQHAAWDYPGRSQVDNCRRYI